MNFLPHGYCFAWTPDLLWSMVAADSLIAAAYFSIPIAIVTVLRGRGDMSLAGIAWLFSAFIFACGVTHVMDVWTIWQPLYRVQTLAKIITASLSVVTALAMWRLIPSVLAIPSVSQLQAAIQSLEAEARRRHDAEDDLFDSQQRLAVALSSMGAGFMATDRAGRVTHMNRVAEQVTGWSGQAGCGRSFWEVFVRVDRSPELVATNPVDHMIERGITVDTRFEFDVMARNGQVTSVEFKTDFTRGADGRVRGAAMVFRDMSRLMRAEAEAARLAAIVESSNDAIVGKDLDGTITTWNRAAETMFGYTAAEAIGCSVLLIVPPSRAAEERAMWATLARGEPISTFDTLGIAKDGSERIISVTVSPIRAANGVVVGASRNARDVSRERRDEAALRDSEAKLRLTMEAARIGEWDLDLRSGVTRYSVLHARCFGYDSVLPDWSKEVFYRHVHPADRAEVERIVERGIEDAGRWNFECRVIWPDASEHWISVYGSALCEGGVAVRLLGIISDITPQKLAENARLTALRLQAENREIQEASRLKSLFVANMSHELRTPLNAIIGFADLLQTGAVEADSPKHKDFIGYIATSGRQLLQLINDILDLSKVEAGKFEFAPRPVQLKALVGEVKDMFYSAMQHKAIEFHVELDPALDEGLLLDAARLKQALCNYVSNAIKFTREGGHVSVRALPDGPGRFRIEVEDDGIGIADEDVPKLFHEFRQLDAGMGKHHQGTGLGLALTRRLIEAQGGEVGMRSTLGKGSVFHFVLDRVHATVAA